MTTFKVFCSGWGEDVDDAREVDAGNETDAAEAWAREADGDSNFVDGYPSGLEVTVIGPDGQRDVVCIDTDWEPSFWAYKAKVPA